MPAKYSLPSLPYHYHELEPYMTEHQLKVHHSKHHKAYVDGANMFFQKLEEARKSETEYKSTYKPFSWNLGGHTLHSLFWENLAPPDSGCELPGGYVRDKLDEDFGDYNNFKKEFQSLAKSVEGSGWAALAFCTRIEKLITMQIEKHNTNVLPGYPILLVLDMFEHAYYIDHENDKEKYVENFWRIVNWKKVDERYRKVVAK